VILATQVIAGGFSTAETERAGNSSLWFLAALAGLAVGFGTLFRPETPLLLVTSCGLLGYWMWQRREMKRWILACGLMAFACALPLLPWTIRNAVTFGEFQPLAPKSATLPGELDPKGFMAWEKTWLYRVRDCYLVPWKLNEESINLEDIPEAAFDSPEEKDRVAAVLETYNDELTLTEQEDAVFAELARERTARHPLRTYVWIPLKRAGRMWFTPRIELIPVSGHVFPLGYMSEEDPVDQRITIFYFLLNIFYVGLALVGSWRLWQSRAARPGILLLLVYILARTAFLSTVETPEPRYTLVCFPALLALGAQAFVGGREKL
jgi:4-amino-4-deoxy-L-arabinose transferase-like glycosyltransferase